jgi:Histidine-specific methyltransferase, SAM-dependent
MEIPPVWLLAAPTPPTLVLPSTHTCVELAPRSSHAVELIRSLVHEGRDVRLSETSWRSTKRSISNVLRDFISQEMLVNEFGFASGSQVWQVLFQRRAQVVRLQPWVDVDYWLVEDALHRWASEVSNEDVDLVTTRALRSVVQYNLVMSHGCGNLKAMSAWWPESRNLAFESLGDHGVTRATQFVAEVRRQSATAPTPARLNRGEFRTLFVWSPVTIDDLKNQKDRLVEALSSDAPVPATDRYSVAEGTRAWLRLADVAVNSHQAASVALAEDIAEEIAESLAEERLDFVSLGPGDGIKDAKLLGRVQPQLVEPAHYYAVDISPLMLATAIMHVEREVPDVCSFGVVADFTQKSMRVRDLLLGDRPDVPNFYSLLGNTIGNLENDWDFLSRFGRVLNRGDFLLLDVRRNEGLSQSIHEIESIPQRRAFYLQPLVAIGAEFDANRLYTRTTTDMRGDIDVKVFCPDVSHPRFGPRTIEVARVKHYGEPYFAQAAEVLNAEIVVRQTSRQSHTEMGLFRKN